MTNVLLNNMAFSIAQKTYENGQTNDGSHHIAEEICMLKMRHSNDK